MNVTDRDKVLEMRIRQQSFARDIQESIAVYREEIEAEAKAEHDRLKAIASVSDAGYRTLMGDAIRLREEIRQLRDAGSKTLAELDAQWLGMHEAELKELRECVASERNQWNATQPEFRVIHEWHRANHSEITEIERLKNINSALQEMCETNRIIIAASDDANRRLTSERDWLRECVESDPALREMRDHDILRKALVWIINWKSTTGDEEGCTAMQNVARDALLRAGKGRPSREKAIEKETQGS